jgi:hypothetical protein
MLSQQRVERRVGRIRAEVLMGAVSTRVSISPGMSLERAAFPVDHRQASQTGHGDGALDRSSPLMRSEWLRMALEDHW